MQDKYQVLTLSVFFALLFLVVIVFDIDNTAKDIAQKNYLASLTPAERAQIETFNEQQVLLQQQNQAASSKALSDFFNFPVPLSIAIGVDVLILLLAGFSRLFMRGW